MSDSQTGLIGQKEDPDDGDLIIRNFLVLSGELWRVVVVNLFGPIMHNIEQGRALVIL